MVAYNAPQIFIDILEGFSKSNVNYLRKAVKKADVKGTLAVSINRGLYICTTTQTVLAAAAIGSADKDGQPFC